MPRKAHEDFTLLQVRTLEKLIAPLYPPLHNPSLKPKKLVGTTKKA